MEQNEERKKEIKARPEKCSSCLCCQLACSFVHTNSFALAKAKIVLNFVGDLERKISFLEECKKCGVCASYCNYGALEVIK